MFGDKGDNLTFKTMVNDQEISAAVIEFDKR